MTKEQWRDIEGTNGKYIVSNYGRVISFARKTPLHRRQITDPSGYKTLRILGKLRFIHVLVARAFLSPKTAPEVNHKNSVKADNHVWNLEWMTRKENMEHAKNVCLETRGGKLWRSKITQKQAAEIRDTFKNPFTAKELSANYGLELSTVYFILRGDTWK